MNPFPGAAGITFSPGSSSSRSGAQRNCLNPGNPNATSPSVMDSPSFLDPQADIEQTSNHLPHWEQDGCAYFLTFRLADSLPVSLLSDWREERDQWMKWTPHPWTPAQEAEYYKRFSGTEERWLDALHGSCSLADPHVRARVAETLFFPADGLTCWSGVVMPNHVHLLCSIGGRTLGNVIGAWKGRSARQANLVRESTGAFWSKDYFDRLVRDTDHFRRCARYIRRNPEKAGVGNDKFTLLESRFVKKMLAAA